VYHHLKKIIKKTYGQDAVNVGDEGGFAPNISNYKKGLDLITNAIAAAGYTGKVKIGMDVAASEFFPKDKQYDLNFKTQPKIGSQVRSANQLIDLYKDFVKNYPIVSIEDPFDQDDWKAWEKITNELGGQYQIVGDDLLVTNPTRINKAINQR
jgi:enolase